MSFARFCIQNLYSRPKPLNYQGYTPAHPYTNYASHCRIIVNLFHVCVSCIMDPLQKAGFEGTAMTSGDGNTCWRHPIFALFMGNYPEQILDTGVRWSNVLGVCAPRMTLRMVKRSMSIGVWGKYWMHFQHLMIWTHKFLCMCVVMQESNLWCSHSERISLTQISTNLSHQMCSINYTEVSSSISLFE